MMQFFYISLFESKRDDDSHYIDKNSKSKHSLIIPLIRPNDMSVSFEILFT